jgi:hypothetical protein
MTFSWESVGAAERLEPVCFSFLGRLLQISR